MEGQALTRTLRLNVPGLLGIGACAALLLTVGCAADQTAAPTPDPFASVAERSDQAFREGLDAYARGAYRDAQSDFERAKLLSPTQDPRIDRMLEQTRAALAPTPTPVPPTPTSPPPTPTATPVAMATREPDTDLGRRYFGRVTLGVVPGRDAPAVPASEFFFGDQIGLQIEALTQHLRLPLSLRIFDTDTGRLVAEAASDELPAADGSPLSGAPAAPGSSPPTTQGNTVAAQGNPAVAQGGPAAPGGPAEPLAALLAPPGPTPGTGPTSTRLVRFYDAWIWYRRGGEAPGHYRLELYGNGVLTHTFDYSVITEPVAATTAADASPAPAEAAPRPTEPSATPAAAPSAPPAPAAPAGSATTAQPVASATQPAPAGPEAPAGQPAPSGPAAPVGLWAASGAQTPSMRGSDPAAAPASAGQAARAPADAQTAPASADAQATPALAAAQAASAAADPAPATSPGLTVPPTPAVAPAARLGRVPTALAISPTGDRLFVADQSGTIWTADLAGAHAPTMLAGLANLARRAPLELAVDQAADRLYVATRTCTPAAPGCVLVLDGQGAVFQTIPLPAAPGALGVDAGLGLLYVALPDRQALAEVDVRGGTLLRTLDGLPEITALAIDPQRHRLFAAHAAGQLTAVDVPSGRVISRTSATGPGLVDVATARGLAYAVNASTHELAVFEPTSESLAVYPLDAEPAAVAAADDSGVVYVLAAHDRSVLEIDPSNGAPLGMVRLEAGPTAGESTGAAAAPPRLALNPADDTLYAALPDATALATIASDTFPALARTIPSLEHGF